MIWYEDDKERRIVLRMERKDGSKVTRYVIGDVVMVMVTECVYLMVTNDFDRSLCEPVLVLHIPVKIIVHLDFTFLLFLLSLLQVSFFD